MKRCAWILAAFIDHPVDCEFFSSTNHTKGAVLFEGNIAPLATGNPSVRNASTRSHVPLEDDLGSSLCRARKGSHATLTGTV